MRINLFADIEITGHFKVDDYVKINAKYYCKFLDGSLFSMLDVIYVKTVNSSKNCIYSNTESSGKRRKWNNNNVCILSFETRSLP